MVCMFDTPFEFAAKSLLGIVDAKLCKNVRKEPDYLVPLDAAERGVTTANTIVLSALHSYAPTLYRIKASSKSSQ